MQLDIRVKRICLSQQNFPKVVDDLGLDGSLGCLYMVRVGWIPRVFVNGLGLDGSLHYCKCYFLQFAKDEIRVLLCSVMKPFWRSSDLSLFTNLCFEFFAK